MKKILFFSAICLVACTGQTGKSSAEADSVSNVVEEVDPYVSVSSASEADVHYCPLKIFSISNNYKL